MVTPHSNDFVAKLGFISVATPAFLCSTTKWSATLHSEKRNKTRVRGGGTAATHLLAFSIYVMLFLCTSVRHPKFIHSVASNSISLCPFCFLNFPPFSRMSPLSHVAWINQPRNPIKTWHQKLNAFLFDFWFFGDWNLRGNSVYRKIFTDRQTDFQMALLHNVEIVVG